MPDASVEVRSCNTCGLGKMSVRTKDIKIRLRFDLGSWGCRVPSANHMHYAIGPTVNESNCLGWTFRWPLNHIIVLPLQCAFCQLLHNSTHVAVRKF